MTLYKNLPFLPAPPFLNRGVGGISEVQTVSVMVSADIFIYFEQLGGGGVGVGAAVEVRISFGLECWNPCLEGCAFYSSCLQAAWDSSCLGTGLCKGYLGLTHCTCLHCAEGSGISEGAYCLPHLVFLGVSWALYTLHEMEQEFRKFSCDSRAVVIYRWSLRCSLFSELRRRVIASSFLY